MAKYQLNKQAVLDMENTKKRLYRKRSDLIKQRAARVREIETINEELSAINLKLNTMEVVLNDNNDELIKRKGVIYNEK